MSDDSRNVLFDFKLLLAGLSLALGACSGTPEPVAPPQTTEVPVVAATPSPAPTVTAVAAPAPAKKDGPATARAFFDAIARHDADAIAQVADGAVGRLAQKDYADATGASFDGPAKPESWPHLPDGLSAYEATLARPGKPTRVVVALEQKNDTWQIIGLRDLTAQEEAAAKKNAAPPEPIEATGKLLSKPNKGTLQVELTAATLAVGDKGELSRQIDPSIPFVGGSWLVIADVEVKKIDGKKVTLAMLTEKSSMNINGKKLDHYTPGVPIRLSWQAAKH